MLTFFLAAAFILFVIAAVVAPQPVSFRIAFAGLACLSVGMGALSLAGVH